MKNNMKENISAMSAGSRGILESANGPLPFSMTNDYLFKALMQQSPKTLSALLSALLHIDPADITDVTLLNPVELGSSIEGKEFFLDIKLELNGNTLVNLELQVLNEHDWPERSLSYLCRTYDNLNRGSRYLDARSAVQVGILDFDLFPECPEFLSSYYMINIKNHKIYSDKFRIVVLNLTQRDLADEEDHAYHTDLWAAFFKATTWEELKMTAKQNPEMHEAVVTIRKLTQDERIRMECEAREEALRLKRNREAYYAEKDQHYAEKDQYYAEKDQHYAEKDQHYAEKDQHYAEKDQHYAETDQHYAEKDQHYAEKDQHYAEKDQHYAETAQRLDELNERLAKSDERLAESDKQLDAYKAENEMLRQRLAQLEGKNRTE